ncbi:MAG: hypothetical protein QM778_00720 [Myxococcales bacterium]
MSAQAPHCQSVSAPPTARERHSRFWSRLQLGPATPAAIPEATKLRGLVSEGLNERKKSFRACEACPQQELQCLAAPRWNYEIRAQGNPLRVVLPDHLRLNAERHDHVSRRVPRVELREDGRRKAAHIRYWVASRLAITIVGSHARTRFPVGF